MFIVQMFLWGQANHKMFRHEYLSTNVSNWKNVSCFDMKILHMDKFDTKISQITRYIGGGMHFCSLFTWPKFVLLTGYWRLTSMLSCVNHCSTVLLVFSATGFPSWWANTRHQRLGSGGHHVYVQCWGPSPAKHRLVHGRPTSDRNGEVRHSYGLGRGGEKKIQQSDHRWRGQDWRGDVLVQRVQLSLRDVRSHVSHWRTRS